MSNHQTQLYEEIVDLKLRVRSCVAEAIKLRKIVQIEFKAWDFRVVYMELMIPFSKTCVVSLEIYRHHIITDHIYVCQLEFLEAFYVLSCKFKLTFQNLVLLSNRKSVYWVCWNRYEKSSAIKWDLHGFTNWTSICHTVCNILKYLRDHHKTQRRIQNVRPSIS